MRLLVGILGLVCGMFAGVVLVLANPVALFSGLPPLNAELAPAKAYRWNGYRGIQANAVDLLGIGARTRAAALADPALRNARVGVVVLPAGAGMPAALAVRISTISEQNSLWRAQLGTLDYWNIFWPGEGSVFATGYSNLWPVVRDSFWAAMTSGDWKQMSPEYPVSAPPPPGNAARVVGASGRFAGFTGEIRESLLPAAGGPDWSLALKVNPPPVATR